MNLLPLNLAKLADAADKKGSSRFALSSVHLRLHGDNTFLAEATDTHQIIRVTGDCPYPADEYPAHPGLAAAPNGGIEALIPLDAWKSAFAMAKKVKTRQPILKSLAVSIGKDVTTFAATNLDSYPTEQTRHVEGRFPPAGDIISQSIKGAKFLFAADAKLLSQNLATLASFSDESEVRVEFSGNGPHKPIGIKLTGVSARVESVVMPLCPSKEQEDEYKSRDSKRVTELEAELEALNEENKRHFREKSELQHQVDELSEKLARFELAA